MIPRNVISSDITLCAVLNVSIFTSVSSAISFVMRDMPFVAAVLTFVLAVSVSLFVVWLYKNVKPLRWIEYIFYPGKLMKKNHP